MAKPSGFADIFGPPPAKSSGAGGPSTNAEFNSVFKKTGIPAAWRQPILAAAKNNGMDPATLAAVVGFEHGWANVDKTGKVTLAGPHDGGVYGPAQIQLSTHPTISQQQAADPAFSIDWMAKQFAPELQKGVPVDQVYSTQYNPGFSGDSRGSGPSVFLSSTYVPPVVKSPAAVASAAQATADAKKQLINDPYVTGSGKLVNSASPPADVIPSPSFKGDGMRASEFNTLARQYNDYWFAYTGKNATPLQLAQFIQSGKSVYQLKKDLSQQPGFTKSPFFTANAPDYVAAARRIMGNDYKPNQAAVVNAVATGKNISTFETELRASKDYLGGQEFKQNVAALASTYVSIYGRPNDNAVAVTKDAALNGWSQDQFAQYLRSQPGYTRTPEYQAKALSFMQQLGLITGQQAVLTPGAAAANTATPVPLPGDARVGPAASPVTASTTAGLHVGAGVA